MDTSVSALSQPLGYSETKDENMTITTTQWDSAEYLKTEEDVQLYLEACLEEAGDDPTFIAHALDVINRS